MDIDAIITSPKLMAEVIMVFGSGSREKYFTAYPESHVYASHVYVMCLASTYLERKKNS